jgi:hypothetical protein
LPQAERGGNRKNAGFYPLLSRRWILAVRSSRESGNGCIAHQQRYRTLTTVSQSGSGAFHEHPGSVFDCRIPAPEINKSLSSFFACRQEKYILILL